MKKFLLAALTTLPILGQDAGAFATTVRPVLAKHCFSCHNAKLTFANLSLEALHREDNVTVWSKVREKVSSGKMPPPGQVVPTKTELAAITTWIDGILKPGDARGEVGRVMARRLNRVEYNN